MYKNNIYPNFTARGQNINAFISGLDTNDFKLDGHPASLILVNDSTGERIDVNNNYTNWVFNATDSSFGFNTTIVVDDSEYNNSVADNYYVQTFISDSYSTLLSSNSFYNLSLNTEFCQIH